MHNSWINQKLQFYNLHGKAYAIWRIKIHINDSKYPSKIKVNILPTTKTIGTSYSHHHSSLFLASRFILNNNLHKYLIQLMAFCLHVFRKRSICNKPIATNIKISLISTYYMFLQDQKNKKLQIYYNFIQSIMSKQFYYFSWKYLQLVLLNLNWPMTLQLIKSMQSSFISSQFCFISFTSYHHHFMYVHFFLICVFYWKNFMPHFPFYISLLCLSQLSNGNQWFIHPVFLFSWVPPLLLHIFSLLLPVQPTCTATYNSFWTLCIKCWVLAFHTEI